MNNTVKPHLPKPEKKHIPNLITSGNLVCGMVALLLATRGHIIPACWMIPVAMAFDFCDGMVARALGVSSDFGVEFDSLGDIVSFGVAPSVLVYLHFLSSLQLVVGVTISVFFTLCAALRLARFNVMTAHDGPFQGLPVPAAGLFLVSWVASGLNVPPAVIAGLTAMSGLLMISSVPYGNLKGLSKDKADHHRLMALTIFLVITLSLARHFSLAILTTIYLISGLLNFNWGDWLSKGKKHGME